MTAPGADAGARQPDGGLRPGILKVRHAVITSLAVITPAAAILFLPIPIAANAGAAMPLAVVVAFVVVLVIMNAVYRFAQRISHAGRSSLSSATRSGSGRASWRAGCSWRSTSSSSRSTWCSSAPRCTGSSWRTAARASPGGC